MAKLAAQVEILERRELFTTAISTPIIAPSTLANSTISASITSSTGPLQLAGNYTIQPSGTGTAVLTPGDGTPAETNTYAYERLGPAQGLFRFTDASSGATFNDILNFSAVNTGTFSVQPLSGAAPVQTGSFNLAPAVSPQGADPTVQLITVPTVPVVAGDTGLVTAQVQNFGNEAVNGDITVNLYISPDGNLADATPVASVPKRYLLGLAKVAGVQIGFTYPQLATGEYFFIAVAVPSALVSDTDQSNDTAFSTSSILIQQQVRDLSTFGVNVLNVGAAGIISGSRQKAVVGIDNDGTRPISGTGHLLFYAAASPNGPDLSLLGHPLPVNIHLKAGQSTAATINFITPAVSQMQGEYFVAVLDTAGLVNETDVVGGIDANNISTSAPVTVSPPTINLQSQVVATVPTAASSGKVARIDLKITNTGNATFRGTVAIRVYISQQPTPAVTDLLPLYGEEILALAIGQYKIVPLVFNYPKTLASGNYYIVAQTQPTATVVPTAIGGVTVQVPAGLFADSELVTVTEPALSI